MFYVLYCKLYLYCMLYVFSFVACTCVVCCNFVNSDMEEQLCRMLEEEFKQINHQIKSNQIKSTTTNQETRKVVNSGVNKKNFLLSNAYNII